MKHVNKIVEYFRSGETDKKRLGVEVEHFICDKNGEMIAYEILCKIMGELCEKYGWTTYCEGDYLIGADCGDYVITLEPAGQLEISINAFEKIAVIEKNYEDFLEKWEKKFKECGYHFVTCGVFPTVESGEITTDDLKLIPKKRYQYMNAYFENSGAYGKYMMRATASTQVSVDYSSMEDCVRKIKILEKISPLLSLLMENHGLLGTDKKWRPHLIRNQIWRDTDKDRCGYISEVLDEITYEKLADYVYHSPVILYTNKSGIQDAKDRSMAQILEMEDIPGFENHLLTMFFFHIRLKKYIEIRIADSVPKNRMLGFAALIKGLMYSENSLCKLEQLTENVKTTEDIKEAERAIEKNGYEAVVYGKTAAELLGEIYDIALEQTEAEEKKYLKNVLSLPMIKYLYCRNIDKETLVHHECAKEAKEYLLNSTAKYHGRVARTMYVPKMFTQNEIQIFETLVGQLYGIFSKVIAEYVQNEDYRKLFGFDEITEKLVLAEHRYSTDIPIARIDIFYDEQKQTFKFCEFNTDGTSAMNEDRELNNALKLTKAYQDFSKDFEVRSFELFDSWVDEFLKIYEEYALKHNRLWIPTVAIVDFLEKGTVNEFEIFRQCFEARGIECIVCDIRDFVWDEERKIVTVNGIQIDAVYRRAVTSDVIDHFDEIGDFIKGFLGNAFCLQGAFRTQIVHNKILYKILHLPETMKLLTKEEQRYVRAHVPYTVSLKKELLEARPDLSERVWNEKDEWIIKPEDSYGSKGVHAGVECTPEEWRAFLKECMDQHYILQEFCHPYRMTNYEGTELSDQMWRMTSNLTGLFVYNEKFSGIYSRISFDEMISTQYNEMSLPTIVVEAK